MLDNSILLLDPYKSLLSTYRTILEGQDYLVETAISLDEGFEKCALKQYAVFITEYLSPFEDICRMIQWLKHKSPETYIIMVTHTDIDKTTYEALFEIGIDDLIFKPYPPDRILVHIRKGIRQMNLIHRKQEVEKQSPLDPVGIEIQQPIFNPTYFRKCLEAIAKEGGKASKEIPSGKKILVIKGEVREYGVPTVGRRIGRSFSPGGEFTGTATLAAHYTFIEKETGKVIYETDLRTTSTGSNDTVEYAMDRNGEALAKLITKYKGK